MKKITLSLIALLILSTFLINCGGGSGGSSSPVGEKPGVPEIVQVLPSHYIAMTNSAILIRAKILNGNGAPIRNIPVTFTNLSPIGVLLSDNDIPLNDKTVVKTNDIGIATVKIKSTVEGFATIQAEVNKGVAIVRDKKTVFFSTTLNLVPFMYLDVDGDNDEIYNETSDFILFETTTDNQVIIRATVFNRFGQRAAFTSVTFGADSLEASFPLGSIKTTDADGEASVLVRVDPMEIRDIQTVLNITAVADNGAANMVTLFLKPVSISNITVYANPLTVDSGGTSKITAFVTTTAGTPAPDGTTVTFTANKGGIDPFSQTTDGWTEEVTFTAPTVTSDTTATITAKVGGKQGSVNVTVIAPPPPPPPPDTTSPTVSSTIPANNGTLDISNAGGNPVPVSITFSENIDCSTVTTATITITPNVADWTLKSCSGPNVVFSGTLTAPPPPSYSVNVGTGVKDLAGNVAVALVFTFKVEP